MSWLRRLLGRRRLHDELSEEIQSHLEETIEELVAGGMSRQDAAAAARRQFGNVTLVEERGRAVWEWPTLESFVMDVRYAVRQLRGNPGLALVVILTLGLGVGANATIFTWTRAVLLNPLPGAREPDRVLAIESVTASGEWVPTSYPDFRDLREGTRSFESMSVTYPMRLAIGADGEAAQVPAELVSGNYFDLLGVRPLAGRFFSGPERGDAQGMASVVVIGHSLWTAHYRSDPRIVGTTIHVNRQPFTVIGVAPAGFHGSMPGLEFQMWVPATMFGQLNSAGQWMLEDRKTRMFLVLARLRPGVPVERARAEVQGVARQLAEANPSTSQGMSAALWPIWQSHYGIQESLRAPLAMLSGVAFVVLLIVCANTANLLLARATSRRKELRLRLALGAARSRLVRQLLTEAALLSVAGALLGVLFAVWLSGSLRWLLPALTNSSLLRPQVDASVLLFCAALATAVTVAAGTAPALFGAREDANEALKEGGRSGSSGVRSHRLRGLLVSVEVALAVVAIVGAGLFVKSFHRVSRVEPGFDADQVVLGQFSLSASGYDAAQADAFCRRLRERLERQPGVVAVSHADYVPLSISAGSWEDLDVEGYLPGPSENMKVHRSIVAPGYFDVMRIPILEGRDFDRNDDAAHLPAMIVNQEFVRRFLGGGYAIGRRVHGWGRWFRIIGVVRDSKYHRVTESARPYFYVPSRQVYRPEFLLTFFVRTAASSEAAVAMLRREAAEVRSSAPLFGARSLGESIAGSMFREKIAAVLLTILASIAFGLAAIGLFGVMACTVAQRTGEIGLRLALGAGRGDVLRWVMRQAATFVLAGLAAGLTAAALVARSLSGMLFSVSTADPGVYAAAAACALLIATAATAIPAIRATRVDPMTALRCD